MKAQRDDLLILYNFKEESVFLIWLFVFWSRNVTYARMQHDFKLVYLFRWQRSGLFADGLQRNIELALKDQLLIVLDDIGLYRDTHITNGKFQCCLSLVRSSNPVGSQPVFLRVWIL